MSKKPSRQGRTSGTKIEPPPAAASDVEPHGFSHSSDRNSDKSSRSSDSLRLAQDAAKSPWPRRRQSSTVPVPLKPNEYNDLSSTSGRRGALRRQQRSSKDVPPYSPGDREPVTASFIGVTSTDAAGYVPEHTGKPRRSSATSPATCSGSPSLVSSTSRTMKEESSELTSDVEKTMKAPVMTSGRRRTGGADGMPLVERLLRAPDNRSAVAVTRDTSPFTSKDPASSGSTALGQATAQPRRSAVTRATLRSTSGRDKLGTGSGMPTEQQPRLEELLQVSPKKENPSLTRPSFDRTALVGSAALLALIVPVVLFALYQGHKADGEVVDLCATPDCIEHVHTLGIDTASSELSCQCYGCFVCSGWSNDFRHVNGSVMDQAILQWIATIHKLSFGDYNRQAVIDSPLRMMRQCMSSTTDEENAVKMLTAFIYRELSSVINNRLPKPRLVEIGRMPKLVRNLSAKDWVRALRSVYSKRAPDITDDDLVLATNGGLIKAVDTIFASNTAQDIFFHTIWWLMQGLGATISGVLRSSAKTIPEGAYFQRLICFYHVDTTYNVLLASINKGMLSTKARLAITSRLDNIRTVVVEKLRAYSKLNLKAKLALSAVVENMSTVIWPEDDFGRPGGFEEYFGKPRNGSDGDFYIEWEWSRLQMYNRNMQAAVVIGDYVAAAEVFAFVGKAVTSYNPVLNVISISVAALRPPYYYGEGTSAMFYGGLGFIYAAGIFRAVDMMAHLLNGGTVTAPSESAVTWSFWNASWCSDVREAERTFPWLPALDVAYTAYLRFKDEASDLRLKGLEVHRAVASIKLVPWNVATGI
ncbi:hypothetical protein HPB52_003870 [Rhipicephalus sanguineus]|uniref:Uncharacterized protein n=1 Tax=Rhipicephalus sanguineus TaxID=34632 RepID=A0A9D4Q9S8_RHISA|nr:hypothetical protein HPB52_003870 [Rhipicephalus sanguineus]